MQLLSFTPVMMHVVSPGTISPRCVGIVRIWGSLTCVWEMQTQELFSSF